ncbi:MAG: ABC transporter permease [Bacteroidaceae bacterium]|nr:ABC transporter permease [Bacteroidaceae bacterium]
MNYELILLNIRLAWRNLMKYKVQNIISVLCLAVGMVVFSMTFISTYRSWQAMQHTGDSRRAIVSFSKQNSNLYITPDILQRIEGRHLPSIGFIDINLEACSTVTTFVDPKGKQYRVSTEWSWISPEHLHYLGLRSAITGKRIPVLKPGDMVMTKGMLARTFGLEVNPIGFTIDRSNPYSHHCVDSTRNVIADVVDMGDWFLCEERMFVVTDQLKESDASWDGGYGMPQLHIILAKGKTEADLKRDLHKVLPEYEVKFLAKKSGSVIQGFLLVLLMGGSVLFIGLFGFLKMQIQLFLLRQREIGLRQCLGAHQGQLFGMLIWEVAIIFLFITPLTLLFTYWLAGASEPILRSMSSGGFLSVDLPRIYATELWICLAVFVVMALIAVYSVRKVVTRPLSEVVGKGPRKLTRGYSLFIVLQMVICQILFCFPMTVIYIYQNASPSEIYARQKTTEKRLGFSPEYDDANMEGWGECMITDRGQWGPEFPDSVQRLKHIQGIAPFVPIQYERYLKEGEKKSKETCYDEDFRPFVEGDVVLTDEHLLDILNLELLPSATDKQCKSDLLVPVYQGTPWEGTPGKLGYIRAGVIAKLSQDGMPSRANETLPQAYYVCNTDFLLQDSLYLRVCDESGCDFKEWYSKPHIILKAKHDEYKDAVRELNDLYHHIGIYTSVSAPVDNMVEKIFPELYTIGILIIVLVVIYFVSLLCMVMTLYSSASLDTRGRLREVAIRKANGAGRRQILWLFGKLYARNLVISSIVSFVFILIGYTTFDGKETFSSFAVPYLYSILFVALVTLLTVGLRIYKVSKLNPAAILKKE